MSKKKFIETIEGMKGKTFQYAGKIHFVESYKVDEQREKVLIKTNLQEFDRTYDNMPEFLSYWKEVNTVAALAPDQQMPALMENETNMVDELTMILKENIEKVRVSPDYIKQAQSINNNVNSIINLTKLKLDVLKFSKNRR